MSDPQKDQHSKNNKLVIGAFIATILICAISMVAFMYYYSG